MDPSDIKGLAPRLPISKCKRIAKTDPDYIIQTQSAYIATAFATELFVQAFSEEAIAMAQLESKKPVNRKQVRLTYSDLARVVARVGKFNFLSDVVPETKVLSDLVRLNKVRYSTPAPRSVAADQAVLPFKKREGAADAVYEDAGDEAYNGEEEEDEIESEEEVEDMQLQRDMEEVARMNRIVDIDSDESSDEERGNFPQEEQDEE
ncbi:HBR396Wp [Eremothecium sinecaudum]|uniref:HBR396Wp n=1 Tax=Eremothecium sinecaudum TaxID=45286 RepID=A0A109UY72_9SACH|nr:HBR396Wp [Eremothecium sinecaudum]AMD19297.1 HBR396Wp [Eremothecium sinecaudum]